MCLLCVPRLYEFVDAVNDLQLRAVEFSSLVPAARRAAHLADFRSGRAQVRKTLPGDAMLLTVALGLMSSL